MSEVYQYMKDFWDNLSDEELVIVYKSMQNNLYMFNHDLAIIRNYIRNERKNVTFEAI